MKKNTAKKFLMKRTLTINADEILTLHLLAQLNDDILTSGLTKENAEELKELQFELMGILRKTIRKK